MYGFSLYRNRCCYCICLMHMRKHRHGCYTWEYEHCSLPSLRDTTIYNSARSKHSKVNASKPTHTRTHTNTPTTTYWCVRLHATRKFNRWACVFNKSERTAHTHTHTRTRTTNSNRTVRGKTLSQTDWSCSCTRTRGAAKSRSYAAHVCWPQNASGNTGCERAHTRPPYCCTADDTDPDQSSSLSVLLLSKMCPSVKHSGPKQYGLRCTNGYRQRFVHNYSP